MKAKVMDAQMAHSEREGYLGYVRFEVEGHKQPYELTLQSEERMDDWNYSLNFLNESGSEQDIEAVEQAIEQDDDFFDDLVEAAISKLNA
ncbi:hypothetical protein GE107_10815 [Cohnella sp. CFH 77786]|uniref:hypothetical protein n=1 Tax=Cohnella sp. CFH 77786 TaxID=2662265 RepID=UPI001C60E3B0|nr:hypothetical protein [Cohnella sp. CFH 77786]MBW5446550.1 hypothetical protein [Cohnella sp. CFH 77786]